MSLLPANHSEFQTRQYWDSFFSQRGGSDPFEWYLSSSNDIFPFLISSGLSYDSKILVVGCGNSELSAELYDHGYKQIKNLDFSTVVIEEMRNRNKHRHNMTWIGIYAS